MRSQPADGVHRIASDLTRQVPVIEKWYVLRPSQSGHDLQAVAGGRIEHRTGW
jgi:hypothetical protein